MATVEQPDALAASTAPARPSMKRAIGIWMATALVVGNMIGSGIFLLPASLASIGPISLLSWVLTGTGAILLALVFANLGRAFPRTGGPYAYAHRAFGDFIGFQTAWGYWIAVWAGNAAIAIAFVGSLAIFWPEAGSNHILAAGIALAAIWIVTLANIAGVREGGIIQLVTTVLKFVPLLLVGVIGLFFMKSSNFTPFAPGTTGLSSQFDAITTAGTLTLWAFIGLESATVPAEEVKNPKRTLPRATIIGTVITTAVYALATIAIMGVIPSATLANSTSPFADAAHAMFGGSWGNAVAVLVMISTFGCLNGWVLLQGRVPLAAARDGLFPKRFAKVSGTRGTPVFGLVVSSIFVTILMLMNYNSGLVSVFTQIILLATLTTLVPYAYSAAAELFMFFQDRELFSAKRLTGSAIIAMLAFAYTCWMIYGAGYETVAKGFLLLMAGIPVYVYLKWQQHADSGLVVAEPLESELAPVLVADELYAADRVTVGAAEKTPAPIA